MKLPPMFIPNAKVKDSAFLTVVGFWIVAFVAMWAILTMGDHPIWKILPGPARVASAGAAQWQAGAAWQMLASLQLSIEAIVWATVIGLGLSYLSTVAFFRPLAIAVGSLRVASLGGLLVIFYLATPNSHVLKVSVLAFAIITFLVNSMMTVIADIPQSKFDHARTMGLNWWEVQREVVVRGTLHNAIDNIRMNAAMAWMMLTAVEGISRSEGGIGVLLLNLGRGLNYPAVFAIQIMILIVGLAQDKSIKYLKGVICPYTVVKG